MDEISYQRNFLCKIPLLFILFFFFFLSPSYALDVTLQWDANSEANLAGYNIYYDTDTGAPYEGLGAQEGNSPVDMLLAQDENPDPEIVEFTLHNLPDRTYYFAVTAYNDDSLESTYSNEATTDPAPDTTAPVISNVRVTSKTDTTAVIEWTTNEVSDSIVQYGTGSSTWGSYPSSQSNGAMVTSHSVTLTGLQDATAYYFRAGSNDTAGNGPTVSNELSFTTDSTPDTTAPVISNVRVTSKTDTTAVIEWTTNEVSDSVVQYGTGSSTWGSYPSSQSNGAMVTGHSVSLTGLQNGTTYYFRTGSNDPADNGPAVSNELSFTTNPAPDTDSPSMVQFPTIDYANNTIDVTFSESNMQNATTEANYSFSPSLLFASLGGSDDIAPAGNNTYRLSMSPIPNSLIFTLTVSHITDAASNPVAPNSIRINDDDNDGMADDWEAAVGISSPSGDADGDGLNNLEEYNNATNPNEPDTDGDNLPDGWEVAYGLNPNDSTGVNGGNGDLDNDGWTNYEEYSSGSLPNNDASPQASHTEIKETIPSHNSGITDETRIPINTSFAIRIEDSEGIDITDLTSIKFTIDDGTNPVYERDLSDTAVVRVVKLIPDDPDSQVTKSWVVYDRSLDTYGNFAYDADVNIMVDAKDRSGDTMTPAGYDFNIETLEEHDAAEADRPETTVSNDGGMTTITVINDDALDGFQVVYDSREPITPQIEPSQEIPPLNIPEVAAVSQPVKLGPPAVFDTPVKIVIPYYGAGDVRDLSLYMYDGTDWVYAVGSYNTGGVVQPGGEGWVVPGSLGYDDTGSPPTLEVQVYHFSGIQAGLFSGSPSLFIDDKEAAAGCFIDTVSHGSPLGQGTSDKQNREYVSLLFFLFLVSLFLAWLKLRKKGDRR